MPRAARIILIPLAALGIIGGTTLPVIAAASAPPPAVHAVHLADDPGVYYHA